MVLDVVGTGATATKMNLFFAMNTLFGLAMLRVDGVAHDRWGTNGMLLLEFAIGAASLAVFVWLVEHGWRERAAELTGSAPSP